MRPIPLRVSGATLLGDVVKSLEMESLEVVLAMEKLNVTLLGGH